MCETRYHARVVPGRREQVAVEACVGEFCFDPSREAAIAVGRVILADSFSQHLLSGVRDPRHWP